MTNYKNESVGLIDLRYPFLKQQGVHYIKQLAGKIWTDHHEHDPGMSVLEVLCFAILDLEYRTNFSIEDILQPKTSQNQEELLKHFYKAEEILPCNPVTMKDLLKIIVDVSGVRNAKIMLHEGDQVVQGGYDVLVDLEERVIHKSQEKQVLAKVKQKLYQHRNLCEDFFSIKALKPLYLGIHASLEVKDEINKEEAEMLIAELLFGIQSFIAPYIKFHSLRTMLLSKQKTVDEIFTGPLLEQGFIDERELASSSIPAKIYVSEILKRVTAMKQVGSVTKFSVVTMQQGEQPADKMVIEVPFDMVPKLSIQASHIKLYQKGSHIPINPEKVSQWYDELVSTRIFKKPYLTEERIAIRKGKFRNLSFHPSIQNDFPLIYGVGKEGLVASASPERKAKAHQLKGYLMIFDQICANYLAQLAHVKDLMAVNNQISKGYFAQAPQNVPDLVNLLRQPHISDENSVDQAFNVQRKYLGVGFSKFKPKDHTEESRWEESYLYYLHKILETNTDYISQKNSMLDHLLARFGEHFTGRFRQFDNLISQHRLKAVSYDKALFLQDYIAISKDRNKGVDLTESGYGWDSDNISGFERRLSRTLGVKNLRRRFLYEILKNNFYLEKSFEQQSFELFLGENLQDKYDNLLILKGNFPHIKELAIRYGEEASNYDIVEKADDKLGIILYVDQERKKFIEFINKELALNSYEQAQATIKQAVGFFNTFNRESEGFHLIEHILLRTSTQLQGTHDPYSFKMTLVMPSWPARFQSEGFKNLLNEWVMLESPAHVFVNVLWLDLGEMETFEKAYKEWIYYRTTLDVGDTRVKQAARHLLGLILLYSQEEV